MAIADYSIETGKVSVVHLEIAQTEKSQDKQVRRNSDDLARAQSIVTEIKRVIAIHKPTLAMAEIPVGAQSARAAFSNGLCCGLLAAVPLPIIQVTPTEVKVAACSSKTASKEAMIQWAVANWPKANWLTRKLKGEIVLMADNEHLADACGAVNAGILTPQFAQAVAMMQSMRGLTAA